MKSSHLYPIIMFADRRLLRRWTARVLLLWSFGFGIGVVNACLSMNWAAPAGTPAVHASSQAGHAHGVLDHRGSLVTSNCQDFCAKATVSVPLLKSALDDIQQPALFVVTVVALAAAVPAFLPVQAWVPRRGGARAPSIPIVYLRLAL